MKIFLIICIGLLIVGLIGAAMRLKKPHQHATRIRHPKHAFDRSHEDDDIDIIDDENMHDTEAEPEPIEPKAKKNLKYIIVHVVAAEEQPYSGYELLQALLSNGLRFGKDKIFHRYEHKTGGGEKLFSLTAVNPPGIFDMPNIGTFSCPGLTLFMILEKSSNPQQAFELLLETAYQLSDDLGGEVWGEDRQPLTPEAISSLRNHLHRHTQDANLQDTNRY